MMINDRGRTVGRRERMYRKVHRVKLLRGAARHGALQGRSMYMN